jgi:DMSO/TMAO reductase YedYZ heme-binding membrane subunit
MDSNVRARFWLECALASVCGLLAVVTLVWRDWIEVRTGLDPDHHSGALEWAILAVLLVQFVVITGAARVEWRRARVATVPPR